MYAGPANFLPITIFSHHIRRFSFLSGISFSFIVAAVSCKPVTTADKPQPVRFHSPDSAEAFSRRSPTLQLPIPAKYSVPDTQHTVFCGEESAEDTAGWLTWVP